MSPSFPNAPELPAAITVDLLAAPGHKGLLGPLGTGLLYVRRGVEKHLESVRQGGTGTHSDRDVQPDGLPDKYEPGSLNVPGLCGLRAGIEYLRAQGAEALRNGCSRASSTETGKFLGLRQAKFAGVPRLSAPNSVKWRKLRGFGDQKWPEKPATGATAPV